MVSADIHQDSSLLEDRAPRITLGDGFVFVATGVVAMAVAAGLMGQLGFDVKVAVAAAAAAFVAMMTGHFALRRAYGRADLRRAADEGAPASDGKPSDRRSVETSPARPVLPDSQTLKKTARSKDGSGDVASDAPGKSEKTKSSKETGDKGAALKDMDLGKFRPRSPADLAKPSTFQPANEHDTSGNIDDMIKRLADDIEAGRKSVDDPAPAVLGDAASPSLPPLTKSDAADTGPKPPPIPPVPRVPPPAATPRLAPTMTEAATPPALPTKAPKAPQSATAKLAAIADALSDEQMDVFLETINDLEDYRAQHYEVSIRLRLANGEVLNNDAFTAETRGTGLLPLLEAVKVSSTKRLAVQMIRRGRSGEFFSAVDAEALADQQFGEDVDTIAGGDAGLAARLVLAFTQNDIRNLTPVQLKTLESIAALGFHFSIEDITDLDMDFEQLAKRGFKFAKLDAEVFLAGLPTGTTRVPAQDICSHLAKSGLSVIVGKINDEIARAKILGFGAIFGQGPLFGAARPVRADMLRPGEQRPPAM